MKMAPSEQRKNGVTKKVKARKKTTLSMQAFRSSLTNGSSLFVDNKLDERCSWARRFRDLIALQTSDLGGIENMSQAEAVLVRRSSMLILQLELMETRFAENDGEATEPQLKLYQMVSNTLRRLLETLGLQRRQRDVTPSLDQYLKGKRSDPDDFVEAAE